MAADWGRMLLSHNFNLSEDVLPALSRTEFTQIFSKGLLPQEDLRCQAIENPHWVVEVIFDKNLRSPLEVGQLCLNCLAVARLSKASLPKPHLLALGGAKSTPAKPGSSPTSLQEGEWGVDVVETPDSDAFLQGIGWEATIANRDPHTIFKVEIRSE